jgi:choline dehydrogenase-like flavoprotein
MKATAKHAEPARADEEFDAVVVGTGFAGAVTACRLAEAGTLLDRPFRICVLERGRRYGPDDFPAYPVDLFGQDDGTGNTFAPPPDFSRWSWTRDHGIYDVKDLGDAISVEAAGYGGGSLIYANVHLRPPRDVFDHRWPREFRNDRLEPYFDLTAYMLRVVTIPYKLVKTLELQRAGKALKPNLNDGWFLTPLAVNFEVDGCNTDGRPQQPCDLSGRCWQGCSRRAKNTLDLNYLARAEDGGADIRTLAEVTAIRREADDRYIVSYEDHLLPHRDTDASPAVRRCRTVLTRYLFLCAGSVNTTALLLRNRDGLRLPHPDRVGSHYFTNSDSFSAVFDCEQPQEADYGPTITAALLHDRPARGDFSQSLDFEDGRSKPARPPPAAGMTVRAMRDGKECGQAELTHDPILDWGHWMGRRSDRPPAAGALALTNITGTFKRGDKLEIDNVATALARSGLVRHRQWFLVEDGGYPPDLEKLIGVFRSPLWIRRNRFLEPPQPPLATRANQSPAQPLRLGRVAEAFGATSQHVTQPGPFERNFAVPQRGGNGEFFLADLLGEQLSTLFPGWFVTALGNDRQELIARAATIALPMLGRLLDEVSKDLSQNVDKDTLKAVGGRAQLDRTKLEALARGVVRQALQIVAGGEVALADRAVHHLLNPVPDTPGRLLELGANLLLWTLAYDAQIKQTALLLTMGRDPYRGRLWLEASPPARSRRSTPSASATRRAEVKATLPNRVLDDSHIAQERVLRQAAATWGGELRTNPLWTIFGKRVTVHSQGGCPMGRVTNALGEVEGCPGLYVMDAAAFPTSVGVNPSATIAAVAEFKIEQFIRSKVLDRGWVAKDMSSVAAWVDGLGRAELDPLNHKVRRLAKLREPPPDGRLGLSFNEAMTGFWTPPPNGEPPIDWADLGCFPRQLARFTTAEEDGFREDRTISTKLKIQADDLARLVSGHVGARPPKLRVTGKICTKDSTEKKVWKVGGDSFLQLFISGPNRSVAERFFRYDLQLTPENQSGNGSVFRLRALKVLKDAPGFDLWRDTSTLYFEMADSHRGVMRVSLDDFVRAQMPSITISGTQDVARQSWALLAFFKYFTTELLAVYGKQLDMMADLARRLFRGTYV